MVVSAVVLQVAAALVPVIAAVQYNVSLDDRDIIMWLTVMQSHDHVYLPEGFWEGARVHAS